MLKKVLLNGTYGYENFISDKEKNLLVSWVNDNLHEFHSNRKGRYFRPLREIENSLLELVEKLKANVIKLRFSRLERRT